MKNLQYVCTVVLELLLGAALAVVVMLKMLAFSLVMVGCLMLIAPLVLYDVVKWLIGRMFKTGENT